MHLISTFIEWGVYWIRSAHWSAGHAPACHHNAAMLAMHVMALEALEDTRS